MCGEDDENGDGADGCRTATPGPRVGQEGTDPVGPDPAPFIPNARGGDIIPYRNRVKPAKGGRAREGSSPSLLEARRSIRRTGTELLVK